MHMHETHNSTLSQNKKYEWQPPNHPTPARALCPSKQKAHTLRWSRSFWSSFWATISAALLRGERMMGTTPAVTSTENSESTISSMLFMISVSYHRVVSKTMSKRGSTFGNLCEATGRRTCMPPSPRYSARLKTQ